MFDLLVYAVAGLALADVFVFRGAIGDAVSGTLRSLHLAR